jgi:hypothetical protein
MGVIFKSYLISQIRVAVTEPREHVDNPKEGELSPLKAVAIRLVKTVSETTTLSNSDV